MKKISTAHMLLLITTGFGIITQLLLITIPNDNIALMSFQMVLSIPAIAYIFVKKQDISEVLRIKTINIPTILLSVLAAMLCYPVSAFISVISSYFIQNNLTDAMSSVYSAGLGFALFATAILPALGEEILFRGVLYHTYSRISPRKGILLSALLFALMHMNFYQMFYAFFIGIIFALMMEAADSLLVPMIMHFIYNATSVINGYAVYRSSNSGIEAQAELIADERLAMGAVLYSYTITALICLGILMVIIYVTYLINKRSIKAVFQKKPDTLPAAYIIDDKPKKNKWVDLWLILFVLYAAAMTVLNTIS